MRTCNEPYRFGEGKKKKKKQIATDVHGSQRMNFNHVYLSLTFHPALSSGQHQHARTIGEHLAQALTEPTALFSY